MQVTVLWPVDCFLLLFRGYVYAVVPLPTRRKHGMPPFSASAHQRSSGAAMSPYQGRVPPPTWSMRAGRPPVGLRTPPRANMPALPGPGSPPYKARPFNGAVVSPEAHPVYVTLRHAHWLTTMLHGPPLPACFPHVYLPCPFSFLPPLERRCAEGQEASARTANRTRRSTFLCAAQGTRRAASSSSSAAPVCGVGVLARGPWPGRAHDPP